MIKLLKCICISILLHSSLIYGDFNKNTYSFEREKVDVVIPCCDKDIDTLNLCIQAAKKYISKVRRIIVVSKEPLTEEAEWFDESLFPFTKLDVALNLVSDEVQALDYYHYSERLGWYYQQLLKLYAPIVIPDISSNVLMLDADTIFLRKVKFLNTRGGGFYAYSSQYHRPYFLHIQQLLGLPRIQKNSGIVNHMLFQREVILDIMDVIQSKHHDEPWKVFCRLVDPSLVESAGASEYELYYNFVFKQTNQVSKRHLKFTVIENLNLISLYRKKGYDFVSCHSYLRE